MYNLQKIILDKYVAQNNESIVSEITKPDGTLVYQLESTFDEESKSLAYRYITAILVDADGYQKLVDSLFNAINSITIDMVNGMSYSDEIDLNEEYTLYHYAEEEIIVLVKTDEWEEIYQIMIDDNLITFEVL